MVKPSKKSIFLGVLYAEDEGTMIVLNVRNYSPKDTVSHLRRSDS